jgi:hypothetical protein
MNDKPTYDYEQIHEVIAIATVKDIKDVTHIFWSERHLYDVLQRSKITRAISAKTKQLIQLNA